LQNPLAPTLHAVWSDNIQEQETVARKAKTPVEEKPADDAGAASDNGTKSVPEPKKKTRPATTAGKKKKPAGSKKSSSKEPTTSAGKSAKSGPVEPTDDEIRLRAYFLAERRHRLSLPGDSNHDWIEARRQLLEEGSR
jgi:outer membrane biosynthesis protein TonB